MFNVLFKRYLQVFRTTESLRFLSSTEVSTALRPFYFSVHPDLFGQHPNQRLVNENSLKQLSSFIETLLSHRAAVPCNLQFYLREGQDSGTPKFQVVNIKLQDSNLRNTINTILTSCKLSTKYLDNVSPQTTQTRDKDEFYGQGITYPYEFDFDDDFIRIKRQIKAMKDTLNLREWLQDNHEDAKKKYEANIPMKKDIDKIASCICETLSILEVKWECGWNAAHLRGCLQSFLALARDYPNSLEMLKGRTLVFAAFTGLSLDGHITLNSGEVRHNWLDFIKNINKHDKVLCRIPGFEKALSQVLRDIKVVRRKFMPKIVAEDYENNLVRLMTTLGDYRGSEGYPDNLPLSMKEFEIVVETEAGPLMVSPTGQFIVPSTCPGSLLINFMIDHLEEAKNKAKHYKNHKYTEKYLHAKCISKFQLVGLRKDDNVTPEVMINCCRRLLENKNNLHMLNGLNLSIATYYSVLSDGTVCIPWNWT